MARFATEQTLRVEVETIDVTSFAPDPDPSWHYVDEAGHGHFYGPGYPTLREITETRYDEDGEYQAHVRWECPHCAEVIVPDARHSFGKTVVPRMKRYYVDEVEVDRATYLVAWRRLAEQRLAEQEAAI